MSKTKLRVLKYSFYTIAYLGMFAPLITILCINFDKYFVQKSGWSVATGGILAILYVALLVKVGFKKINKIVWSVALLVIVYCLESILQDAVILTLAFTVGIILFEIFSVPGRYYSKKLNAFDDEEVRVAVRRKQDNGVSGGRY